MLNFDNTDHSEKLDSRIAELLDELKHLTGDEDTYTATAKNLATLVGLRNDTLKIINDKTKLENEKVKAENDFDNEAKKILNDQARISSENDKIELDRDKLHLEEDKFAADQEDKRSWKPTPDAVVGAAASVVSILFVLHYEKLGVITSKALGFVGKTLK